MKYQFEKTDTFGGEPNYSWVQCATVEVPMGTSDKMVNMLAREWAGWAGRLTKTEQAGDMTIIRPSRGLCQVLFVTVVEDEPKETTVQDVERWALGVRQAMAGERWALGVRQTMAGEYKSRVTQRERDLSAAVLSRTFAAPQDVGAYLAHLGVQGPAYAAAYDKVLELAAGLPTGQWRVEVLDTDEFDEELDVAPKLGISYGEEVVQVRALGTMVTVAWYPK